MHNHVLFFSFKRSPEFSGGHIERFESISLGGNRKGYGYLYHYILDNGYYCFALTLRGPSYLGLTRSISWLLMPLRRQVISSHGIDCIEYVGRSLTWGRIVTTCVISMWKNDTKCIYAYICIYVPSEKNWAHKGLILHVHFEWNPRKAWHSCPFLVFESNIIQRTYESL